MTKPIRKSATKAAPIPSPADMTREVVKSVKPIRPSDIQPAGQINNSWEAVQPADMTREELENPELWKFMGNRFKEMDQVRVTADDCSWVAKGVVHQVVGSDVALVFPERDYLQLSPRSESELDIDNHFIRNCGRIRKYVIVHKGTGNVVKENLATQLIAIQYLKDHLKAHQQRVS